MFKDLMVFDKQRNIKQAIGFYLAFLALGMVATIPFAVVFADDIAGGIKTGARIGIAMAILLAVVIAKQKQLLTQFGTIVTIVMAGALAAFGGMLLGLIPVAYLTTRERNNSESRD